MANQFSERDRTQQRFREEDEEQYGRGFNEGDAMRGRGRQARWSEGQRSRDYSQGRGRSFSEPVWTYTEMWFIPGPYSGRGPSNYQRSNERIQEDVCERLTYYGQLDASNIEVEVEDGEVTLTGTVDSRRSKRMAEDIAESVTGVRDIHNQLRIDWDGENE